MDAKKLAKKREKKRLKKIQAKRSEKKTTGNQLFDSEAYRQVFEGEGAEPLTDAVIHELVEHHNWTEQDLLKARDAGAQYSRARHSLIFPPVFDLEDLESSETDQDSPISQEERERHRKIIEYARQEADLPEETKFCGYIVHLPEQDEFLADVKELPDRTLRSFAAMPDHAKRYNDFHSAALAASGCKQETIVSHLFDIGRQYIVMGLSGDPEAELG